jgi:hypothetical protein
MAQLNLTALAEQLNVSKGRVSQYVSEGKLEGCFEGVGRQRRFDLAKCAKALGKKLDPGQMMGNGGQTQKAISAISETGNLTRVDRPSGASGLKSDDDDGYKMARTQKAVEEARRLRRQNAEAEGVYVLASEVALQTKRLVAQEVAEFESVLRDGARQIADDLGVDFKKSRSILIEKWRAHRATRTKKLQVLSEGEQATDAEKEADI